MAPGTVVGDLGDQRACTGLLMAEGATTELAIYQAVTAAGSLRPVLDGS
jgi:hypothetical protein